MCCFFFFFKQKTAYEMRISDWSSDVCSSDLIGHPARVPRPRGPRRNRSKSTAGWWEWVCPGRPRHRARRRLHQGRDRKSVVSGKSVSVRVALGGRRIIKKKKDHSIKTSTNILEQ